MTDALPADTPELVPARSFDSARLIAQVRAGDAAAVAEAYRITFGTSLGRVVLLHALSSIGLVGQARTAESPEQSNHTNGRGYAVLEIARLAGFDPVAVAAAGMTQMLEGADYEQHTFGAHAHAGNPAVEFGDAPDADAEPDPFAFSGGAPEPDPDAGSQGA